MVVKHAAWGIIQLLDLCSLQVLAHNVVNLLAADALLFSPHLLAVATKAAHNTPAIRVLSSARRRALCFSGFKISSYLFWICHV